MWQRWRDGCSGPGPSPVQRAPGEFQMNVSSIMFALGTVSMLAAAGCAANVEGESTGSSGAAIMSGGGNAGPGPEHPIIYEQVTDCGGTGALSAGPSPWNQNEGQ